MATRTTTDASSAASSREGFTLIEVVVAMVLLALGILGVMHLSVAATVLARNTVAMTELGIRAENVLESARDRGYTGNPAGVTTDSVSVRGHRYARRVTVTDQGANAREIRVDVIRAGQTASTYSVLTYVVR